MIQFICVYNMTLTYFSKILRYLFYECDLDSLYYQIRVGEFNGEMW